MTVKKWKSVLLCWSACLLIVSAGYFSNAFGFTGANSESNAASGQTSGKPDFEPIEPELALQNGIRKELRLSKNQIEKLDQAWNAGKEQAPKQQKRRAEIRRQILDLEKKLADLRTEDENLSQQVSAAQRESLKKAIKENLSDRALARLREITLQQRSLPRLFLDPRIQAKLNVNDEQIKKLQELKDSGFRLSIPTQVQVPDGGTLLMSTGNVVKTSGGILILDHYVHNYDAVMKILTPEQRKTWKQMIGEPYPRPKTPKKK